MSFCPQIVYLTCSQGSDSTILSQKSTYYMSNSSVYFLTLFIFGPVELRVTYCVQERLLSCDTRMESRIFSLPVCTYEAVLGRYVCHQAAMWFESKSKRLLEAANGLQSLLPNQVGAGGRQGRRWGVGGPFLSLVQSFTKPLRWNCAFFEWVLHAPKTAYS